MCGRWYERPICKGAVYGSLSVVCRCLSASRAPPSRKRYFFSLLCSKCRRPVLPDANLEGRKNAELLSYQLFLTYVFLHYFDSILHVRSFLLHFLHNGRGTPGRIMWVKYHYLSGNSCYKWTRNLESETSDTDSNSHWLNLRSSCAECSCKLNRSKIVPS